MPTTNGSQTVRRLTVNQLYAGSTPARWTMKTLGIIGGMGPEATNQLVLKIISKFDGLGQKNRPDILVSFVPVNLENETELINNNSVGDFPELLINSAKKLERGGADFIIIACNTVHIFIEQIRQSVNIPVLSVIEETQVFLKKNKIDNVNILASNFTVNNRLFDSNNVKITRPAKKIQNKLNILIDKLAKGNGGNFLVACSDLQNIIQESDKIRLIDTMDILTNVAVKNLLNDKLNYDNRGKN